MGCSVLVVRSNLSSFGISFFLELHESTTLQDGVIMANMVSFVMHSLTQFNLFKLKFLNTIGTNHNCKSTFWSATIRERAFTRRS